MILKLEHTTTHQTYEYEVSDMNNGEKLYFRFDINTSNLDEGEYYLSIYDKGDIVCSDILKIGDYNPNTLQYSKGENTYINVTLDATIQGDKMANINTIVTNITPDVGYNAMSSVEVNAQELFDGAFEEGNKIGFQDGKTIGEEIGYINGKTDGYNQGKEEWYEIGYQTGHNDGSEEGYENGFENGKQFQKDWMQSITITENGTYTREDGYNEVVVNVEDTNGSFDDGYNTGYEDGVAEGVGNAGEIIAETARVLDITENGTYFSRYSDIPEDEPLNVVNDGEYTYIEDTGEITGYFDDGRPFYGCAKLYNEVFDTGIVAKQNSRIELWYKPNGEQYGDAFWVIIGATNNDGNTFQIRFSVRSKNEIRFDYGADYGLITQIKVDEWNRIIYSKDEIIVNGVNIGKKTNTYNEEGQTFYINSAPNATGANGDGGGRYANGYYGMVKIDNNIFVPTPDGFTKTNSVIKPDENLIKTVYVNVSPALNANNLKLSFGYSSFEKIPDGLINWSKITNMDKMFMECNSLKDLGDIDTSNVTSMVNTFNTCNQLSDFGKLNLSNVTKLNNTFRFTKITDDVIANFDTSNVESFNGAFQNCSNIKVFPSINTSKAKDFSNMFNGALNLEEVMPIDTSNATNIAYMFYDFSGEHKLRKLPEFECTNVTSITNMFSYYQDRMDYFTDCGGWKNLKCKWDDNYGLRACTNLTYQSCINILNGLYDFTGNGETPNSNQGKLKVAQSFIDTVGDEISIGTNKGWTISV